MIHPHMLEGLPVDIASVTYLEDDHLAGLIIYKIDHPVIALSNAILIFTR